MIIMINGKKKNCTTPHNLLTLIEQEGYGNMLIAVALNGTFISRSNYITTILNDGDKVEIVAPMQGG